MSNDLSFPQVDRRAGLSLREFNREYRSRGKPVVITDAIEAWKARSLWTFDYFKSRYGTTLAEVYHYREDDKFEVDHTEHMPLGDYIDRVLTNDWDTYPCYLRDNWRLFVLHKELLADYKVPSYFFDWFTLLPRFMRLIYPRIFIGPKGAVTPLHHDIWDTHAWLTQLVGRKRWLLFSPHQRELLYSHLRRPDRSYQVRPDQPDLEQFPLFQKAKPLECTIGPGDTIFIPSGWPHQVTSLDPTISLTYNYMGPGCFGPCLANAVRHQLLQRLTINSLSGYVGRRIRLSTSK